MVAKFFAQVTENGGPGTVIVVNGQDVSRHVEAFAVLSKVGEPTTLQVHTRSEGKIEGEGVVEVYVDNQKGLGQWLREVDRKKVDKEAMGRGGWGDSSTLTDHVIDVLLEMLDATEPTPHP